MKVEMKINCRQKSLIEGYVNRLTYDKVRKQLDFELLHLTISAKKAKKDGIDKAIKKMFVDVRLDFNQAERVAQWLKVGDLVEVEGQWRWDGKHMIHGIHVAVTEPIKRPIQVEEETNEK